MGHLKPKQKDNCLFTAAEINLLARLHGVADQAVKNKSKAERAEVMQAIGGEHQDLMIWWLMCGLSGQMR